MKYMVMECHQAYAVLMDENSRFIHAANLHYKVGQVVTDPVIMESTAPSSRNIRMIVTAAAAACLVLFAGTGYRYYANNFRTHSTIVISTEANITMELNSKGEVLSLKSDSESGREILKNYSGKGKDKTTVANEIIEIEKSKGLISDGNKVEFYVSSNDPDSVNSLRKEMDNIKARLEVPAEKHEEKAPEPVKPAETPQEHEAAPPVPAAPKADEKLAEPPKTDPAVPAEPPVHEPPKAEQPAVKDEPTPPTPEPPAAAENPPAAETPQADEKLPHEKHEAPAHEVPRAEPPKPNENKIENKNKNGNKNENHIIHKPHEGLTDTEIRLPETHSNDVHLPKLIVTDPENKNSSSLEDKFCNESPLPDLK